jgi:hypothetical protein
MALKNCQASKKRNTVFAEKADESAYAGTMGGKPLAISLVALLT